MQASVAQTSVPLWREVCGSCSDSRFPIQGQTGRRQPAATHGLRRAHAAISVHAGATPESGNLRHLSRRSVTNKTSQAADVKGRGLRYLAFTSCTTIPKLLVGGRRFLLELISLRVLRDQEKLNTEVTEILRGLCVEALKGRRTRRSLGLRQSPRSVTI